MDRKIKILASSFVILSLLVLSGCGCKKTTPKLYSLSLEIWGTLDDRDVISEIAANYKQLNPNITEIVYKKIGSDTYQKELTDALASGQGPDIFLINNTWLPSFKNKIVPAPEIEGVVGISKFQQSFVDTAESDLVDAGQIYAVPLSVDSLALYYNKDLFNEAGITSPPVTWNEFADDVHRLTKINSLGEINQAGAAIGSAYNINRSTDILGLLMMQKGAVMVDGTGRPGFEGYVKAADGHSFSPGQEALDFYTHFAQSGSLYYTWNPTMHYSIDAFSEGTAAMMINYSWHIATIESKSPKLNFAVAPVPQFDGGPKVDFSNYWGYAVAKNKIPVADPYGNAKSSATNDQRAAEAWKFLTYLTTKPDGSLAPAASGTGVGKAYDASMDPGAKYIEKNKVPAARRDLIEKQKADPKLGAFAAGNLIAKNWRQADPASTEAIFAQMIDSVNRGQSTVAEAIQSAVQRVKGLSSN